MAESSLSRLSGALLIDKPAGISSFGVIETLQRLYRERASGGVPLKRRELPKIGHGGTLDPFATGLLIVCVGPAVKLARYFLGSRKSYEGVIRFGETTVPGDPTAPISETSERIPQSLVEIQSLATKLTLQDYLQTPPMHSAKKVGGKPLYELARQGIDVDRDAKLCRLHRFDIHSYSPPRAEFSVDCSSGTYIRTLAKDLALMMGSVAMLDSLRRTASGSFSLSDAWTLDQIAEATRGGQAWGEMPCWIAFDRLLDGVYPVAEASAPEAAALLQGKQGVLPGILSRTSWAEGDKKPECANSGDEQRIVIYNSTRLVAVALREHDAWGLERVFTE
jgi:tRNA pseudouridine55 synthase